MEGKYWQGCVEKRKEFVLATGPNENMWRFSKKLKTELSYDPTILPLGAYPKEMESVHSRRDHCAVPHSLWP
jgi:hypothetical protein